MAIDPRISLAANPNIQNTFRNALLNVQGAENLFEQREQAPLRSRLLEAQVGGAEAQQQAQQELKRFTSVAFGAASLLPHLQTEDPQKAMQFLQTRRAQLIQDNRPTETTDRAIATLGQEGVSELRRQVQQVVRVGEQQGILKVPVASQQTKFIGTPSRTTQDGKNFLTGLVRQPDGTFQTVSVPVEGEFVSILGETAEQEVETEVQKRTRLAALELKTKPTIEGAVETEKGKAQIKTEDIKQVAKINNSRIAELNQGGKARTSSTRKAKQFLRAIKDGKAFTGATRAAAQFIPGVFTTQAEFDEKFNAFSEVAARQKLKATGEIRPTDADVEGMKRAIFGVGRDENVNIQLLEEFISDQDDIDNELDDLLAAKRGGNIGTFTKTVKPEDLVKLTDEELLDF